MPGSIEETSSGILARSSSASLQAVFLANDAIFDQAVAFLESFRTHNPWLKLGLIPFADDMERLERIAPVFGFEILELNTQRWDELAEEFYPGKEIKYKNRLRKMAIFDLEGQATIYIDTDTVVLKDLSFIASKFKDDTADLICTAINNDPWVYNENFRKHEKLAKSLRFSDGFFAFGPCGMKDKAYEIIVENKDLFLEVRAEDVFSQPATNFVADMMGLRLREIYRLFPGVSPQVWYAGRLSEVDDGVVADDGREVLRVHWAGPVDFKADFRLKRLFERYRSKGMARIAEFGLTTS